MLARIQARSTRGHRKAASDEIAKLAKSVDLLWPGRSLPLRIRLSLRVYDRFVGRASTVNFICGIIAGVWWPMPMVILLDDRHGSIRDVTNRLYDAAEVAISTVDNPGTMIEQLIRIFLGWTSFLALSAALTIGPTVLALRVSRGYPGIRFPGREVVIFRHRSHVVHTCTSVIAAIAGAFGKAGERRVVQLHHVVGSLVSLRKEVLTLPRLEDGPREGRRKRRQKTRRHVRAIAVVLERMADQVGDASDQELREHGETVMQICQRLADRRYAALLDAEQLPAVSNSHRDPIRFALGAVFSLILSAVFMGGLNILGVAEGLEPIAIGASVVVSSVIIFGGKAIDKLEALGLIPENSGRIQQ